MCVIVDMCGLACVCDSVWASVCVIVIVYVCGQEGGPKHREKGRHDSKYHKNWEQLGYSHEHTQHDTEPTRTDQGRRNHKYTQD